MNTTILNNTTTEEMKGDNTMVLVEWEHEKVGNKEDILYGVQPVWCMGDLGSEWEQIRSRIERGYKLIKLNYYNCIPTDTPRKLLEQGEPMILVEWEYEGKDSSLDGNLFETCPIYNLKELEMQLDTIYECYNGYRKDDNFTYKLLAINYYECMPIEDPEELLQGAIATSREEMIEYLTPQWAKTGALYRQYRKSNNLTKSYVAKTLGVSSTSLTNFEEGRPCKRARSIECGYNLLIKNMGMQKKLQMMGTILKEKIS
ncbi:helix-turn-helix domain-containing protein [Anaerosinus massiliensis]|uniref:helix-turn-helix domain-containing protein n=1 Tax=Massilibacillus massiliensis TaxID=1806837 RepID=UPI000DA5ECD8|nr:hypothetical protein [Massilibacillus massiliensis]